MQSKGFLKSKKAFECEWNGGLSRGNGMVLRIVQRQAGDNYDVVNKLVVM